MRSRRRAPPERRSAEGEERGRDMEEKTILTELGVAIDTLKTLALVTLNVEETHPLALPEPPASDKVAAYERHMNAISQELATRLRPLPAASLRDYRAGFPDRAGSYLLELVNQLLREPEYVSAFSPAARKRLQGCVMDLREL
ncbi:MAG: hypothetical protein DME04_26160 [Candidatus Rokuibacteriota bacterium]|nr:MAG: hypothetical protein DME04_26160 [Candidatus Rokubacteria bacterium]